METKSLIEIQEIVKKLMQKLPEKIELNSILTFGDQEDLAKPNVEIDNYKNYNIIIIEKGQELERIVISKFDDLIYWIFEKITFRLASNYEMNNRNKNEDFRRILFKKQEQLLGVISDEWKTVKENEHSEILNVYPFKDKNDRKNDYWKKLIESNFYTDEIIELLVNKEYP